MNHGLMKFCRMDLRRTGVTVEDHELQGASGKGPGLKRTRVASSFARRWDDASPKGLHGPGHLDRRGRSVRR